MLLKREWGQFLENICIDLFLEIGSQALIFVSLSAQKKDVGWTNYSVINREAQIIRSANIFDR